MSIAGSELAFTRGNLDAMPEDGRRHELLDGILIVTPALALRHQVVSSRLQRVLDRTCPDHLIVLSAPVDLDLGADTRLRPDLLVIDSASALTADPVLSPHLVVEILSPHTRLYDQHLKRAAYEAAGVPAYWLVGPGSETTEPSLTILELTDGAYVDVAQVTGAQTWTAQQPFAVAVTPASLIELTRPG